MEWILINVIIPFVIGVFIGLIIGTILVLKGYRVKGGKLIRIWD